MEAGVGGVAVERKGPHGMQNQEQLCQEPLLPRLILDSYGLYSDLND